MTIVRVIATVIIPPLGVFLKRGVGWPLLISIVLTLLGYIPGLVYALYIVFTDERRGVT